MQSGAVLTEVIEGSPAEASGLRPGNIIVSVDGEPLTEGFSLADAIGMREPGDRVALEVWRRGATDEVRVKLGQHPDNAAAPWLGVRFTTMSPPDTMRRFNDDN